MPVIEDGLGWQSVFYLFMMMVCNCGRCRYLALVIDCAKQMSLWHNLLTLDIGNEELNTVGITCQQYVHISVIGNGHSKSSELYMSLGHIVF